MSAGIPHCTRVGLPWVAAIGAVRNAALRTTDGICDETPEQCIRNMARIGIQGMTRTDAEILTIMTKMGKQ